VPFPSSHSLFECRQHTVGPDARMRPFSWRRGRSGRGSRERHCDRGVFPWFGRHVSISLHPFAPPELPGFVATMSALTPERRLFVHESRTLATGQSGVTAHEHRPVPFRSPCFMDRIFQPFRLQALIVVPGSVCFRPGLTIFHLGYPVCRGRMASWASPLVGRFATTTSRIEFVILRTSCSPPVASHPVSRRRSYVRLQSSDQL
jgi:hypothetical protein